MCSYTTPDCFSRVWCIYQSSPFQNDSWVYRAEKQKYKPGVVSSIPATSSNNKQAEFHKSLPIFWICPPILSTQNPRPIPNQNMQSALSTHHTKSEK